ncbi:MAG: hypothetical protein ACPHP8_04630, partial [Luminiphilus sp.]
KMKVLILENCLLEPPEIKPNDWKVIRENLLKNIKVEDAPPESSCCRPGGFSIAGTNKQPRQH